MVLRHLARQRQLNRAHREPWLVLNQVPFPGTHCLCTWCRYARWSGSCEEAEADCEHPLGAVQENSDDVGAGQDCRGFRPNIAPEDAADVVGIWLNGQQPDWSSVPRRGRRVRVATELQGSGRANEASL